MFLNAFSHPNHKEHLSVCLSVCPVPISPGVDSGRLGRSGSSSWFFGTPLVQRVK